MSEQRVDDVRLANRIAHQAEFQHRHAGIDTDIALDLRDARAELAALKAELRSAEDLVDLLRGERCKEIVAAHEREAKRHPHTEAP